MKLYLDTQEFNAKPTGYETGEITQRILENKVDLTPEKLANEIIKGKTMLFGIMNSSSVNYNNLYEQELVALDFDNQESKTVKYTIQQALSNPFVLDNALFLYKTFSHTEEQHRFRIVFRLDTKQKHDKHIEQIYKKMFSKFDEELSKQGVIDISCIHSSRLFFGGTAFIKINFDNKLSVKDLMADYIEQKELFEIDSPRKSVNTLPTWKLIQARSKEADEEVRNRWTEVNKVIKMETTLNAKEYFKSLNMADLLGIDNPKKFNDIFSTDENPSASIFKMKEGACYLYKRFNASVPAMDIVTVVSKLRGISITNSVMYISQMLNVQYGVDSENIKNINKAIDEFKHHLLTLDLSKTHPETHKLLKDGRTQYGRDISDVLEILRNHIIEVNGEPRMISHLSTRELSIRIYGKETSYNRVQRVLRLMQLLGIITKLKNDEIPNDILDGLLKFQVENKFSKRTDVHEIKEFGTDFLVNSEREAGVINSKGLTSASLTRYGIMYEFGKEKANDIFVQDAKEDFNVSKHEMDIMHFINGVVQKEVEKAGYIEETDIIEELAKELGKTKSKMKWKQIRNEFTNGYGYERTRLNKALKKEFGVSAKYTQTQAPNIIKKLV